MAEKAWVTRLNEQATAPWWPDLSLEEKQAAIELVIDPERPESPFYGRPDVADEIRPLLRTQMQADKPASLPFAASPAGKAVHWALDPLVKLDKTPEQAGDQMLAETGSPAIGAATKVLREFGEGFTSPLSLALPGVPSAVQGVRGVRHGMKPPVAAGTPPPAAQAPPGATIPPVPVEGAVSGSQPATGPLAALEAVSKQIRPVPEGKPFGMPQKKAGRVFEGKGAEAPEIVVTDLKGTKTPVRVTVDEAARLDALTAQLSTASSSPMRATKGKPPFDKSKLIGQEAIFTVDTAPLTPTILAPKVRYTTRFVPPNPKTKEGFFVDTTPAAAETAAKAAGRPYTGTAFRARFEDMTGKGAPLADNIADPVAADGHIVAPGVPGVPSPIAPRAFWRMWQDGISVVGQLGPAGARAKDAAHRVYDLSEGNTMKAFSEWDRGMQAIFGKRGTWDLFRMNPFADTNATRMYNMTAAESDNLVDVLYTAGKTQALNEKVEKAAQLFFATTKKMNEHPGIRTQTVKNPWTQVEKPVGDPTMFYPQQVIKAEDRLNIRMERSTAAWVRWKKEYEANNPGKEGTRSTYENQLRKIEEERLAQPEMNQAYYMGVNNARTFVASDYGAPHEVLRRGGYNADPASTLFNYLAKANLLAERTVAKEELSALQTALETQYPHTPFIGQTFNIITGQGKAALLDRETHYWGSAIREFNSATLLQLAAIPSLAQTSYPIMRAGWKNSAKGLARALGERWSTTADKALSEHGGALYSHYIQELTQPQSAFGKIAQTMFRMNAFGKVDEGGRVLAAHIGRVYANEQAAIIAAGPSATYNRALAKLKELHIDTAKVEANKGVLTLEDELLAAQTFANQTMGRTYVGGIPTWLAGADEKVKILTQFKSFLFANSAEMARAIKNAPDAYTGVQRALTLAVGTQVSGELVNDTLYIFRHMSNDHFELPSGPFGEKPERDAKAWKKFIGSPLGARAIENWVAGIGTVWAGLFMMGLPDESGVLKALVGPTGATLAAGIEDISKLAEGEYKHPLESHLAEDVARRFQIPGVMSILGDTPTGIREARKRRRQNPLRLPGMQPPRIFENEF